MFCQAVRITFSSSSCLELTESATLPCCSHISKVTLITLTHTHTQTNPTQSSLDITQLDTRELTSAPGMLVNALSSLLLVIIDASYSPVQPRKYVRFWPTLCTCRPSTSLVCLWLSASLGGVLQRKPRFCCVSHRTVWSAVAGLIALVARHSQRCHPADTGTFVVCQ